MYQIISELFWFFRIQISLIFYFTWRHPAPPILFLFISIASLYKRTLDLRLSVFKQSRWRWFGNWGLDQFPQGISQTWEPTPVSFAFFLRHRSARRLHPYHLLYRYLCLPFRVELQVVSPVFLLAEQLDSKLMSVTRLPFCLLIFLCLLVVKRVFDYLIVKL